MRQVAYFFDDQEEPAPEPFNSRAFHPNWPLHTQHRLARQYGKKYGWYFYRLGQELDSGERQLRAQMHKVWRYL